MTDTEVLVKLALIDLKRKVTTWIPAAVTACGLPSGAPNS